MQDARSCPARPLPTSSTISSTTRVREVAARTPISSSAAVPNGRIPAKRLDLRVGHRRRTRRRGPTRRRGSRRTAAPASPRSPSRRDAGSRSTARTRALIRDVGDRDEARPARQPCTSARRRRTAPSPSATSDRVAVHACRPRGARSRGGWRSRSCRRRRGAPRGAPASVSVGDLERPRHRRSRAGRRRGCRRSGPHSPSGSRCRRRASARRRRCRRTCRPVTARPWAWAAVSKSSHVAPPCDARPPAPRIDRRRPASGGGRSTRPSSTSPWPATLWPPPRTPIGRSAAARTGSAPRRRRRQSCDWRDRRRPPLDHPVERAAMLVVPGSPGAKHAAAALELVDPSWSLDRPIEPRTARRSRLRRRCRCSRRRAATAAPASSASRPRGA